MNIVLAGGGTAGHTSPLIATAHSLSVLEPASALLCIGTPKGLENRVIPAAGLDLALIPPVPLPRRVSPELLALGPRLVHAVVKAARLLRRHRAEVVVGFGGYVSLPVYLAAALRRIPVVVHEQNALPGLANKVAARLPGTILTVTFEGTPLPRAQRIGLPMRPALSGLDRVTKRSAARAAFGFTGDHPLLLVSGGSQGARSINLALEQAVPALLAAGVSVLHVLGPTNFGPEHTDRLDAATGAQYRPVAYVDAMEDAYAAAEMMLGRSGAGTVMETAAIGLPTIFVPLPHGNGEQARNADFLIAAEAAVVVADADLDPQRLLAEVLALITDPARLATMGDRARELVPADAAERLAHIVLAASKRR